MHVVDDGPGFDSHLAPPGYGISETLGRQPSHTGGRAVVTSELGMGTRVEIFIPRSAVTGGLPCCRWPARRSRFASS